MDEIDAELGLSRRQNLYDEVRTPMGAAFLMFLVADVREMARNGELSGDPELIQKVLDLPIDGYEFISLYKENKEAITKKIDSEERYEMYSSIFNIPEDADAKTAETMLRSMELLYFDDAKSEDECVFSIGINHLLKRVTLAFRGSVTPKDFAQDAKALFTPIKNPVTIPEDAEHMVDPLLKPLVYESVLVHLGFREYLYGETSPFFLPEFVKKVGKASREHFEAARKASAGLVPKPVLDASESFSDVIKDSAKRTSFSTASAVKKASKSTHSVVTGSVKVVSDVTSQLTPDLLKGGNTKEESEAEGNEHKTKIDTESGIVGEKPAGSTLEKTANNMEEEVEGTETKKKYEVMLEMLGEIHKQNPGYELYICGHSLGGALATLFTFEAGAASDDVIPKPVTCVTSGAPKVGNLHFLHAFEALEEQKKVRYIRVCNFRDIVPLSPPGATYNCCFAAFCQPTRFRHVGLRLKLYPKGYTISYVPKMRTCPGIACCDLIKILRHWLYLVIVCPIVCFCKNRYTYKVFRSEHTQLVYMDRFDACREDLEDMTLDDLYQERINRARWRMPVLHGGTHIFAEDEYKKKPYKSLNAILEV